MNPPWDIPNTWSWTTVGDVATVVGGGTPQAGDPANFAETGIPWLTPADLSGYQGSTIQRGARDLSEKGLASSSAKVLPEGTVLYTSRAPIGYCVVAVNPISTNQGFKSLVLGRGMSPFFVRHYLLSVKEYAQQQASGTTFLELSGTKMKELLLAVAPLNEQARIAAKIEALQARLAAANEALDAIPLLLEKFRQSVLAAAFRGDLTRKWRDAHPDVEPADSLVERTPIPQGKSTGRAASDAVRLGRAALSVCHPGLESPPGWKWVPLSRIAKMESGHTPSREHPDYWDGEIPWIGIADARENHGRTINSTFQTVTDEGLANSAARLLPARTVCLSRTASVGYVTIMGRPMATSQDFADWICTEALLPEYLMYALLAEGETLRTFGEGSTHTTIYFPELKALHICLAPIEEQREIVRIVEERLAAIQSLEGWVRAALERAAEINQSILAKAFRGELVPQDPNDEPASVLLERIRRERERTGDVGKTGRRGRRPGTGR